MRKEYSKKLNKSKEGGLSAKKKINESSSNKRRKKKSDEKNKMKNKKKKRKLQKKQMSESKDEEHMSLTLTSGFGKRLQLRYSHVFHNSNSFFTITSNLFSIRSSKFS
jgi:hypothetical protein